MDYSRNRREFILGISLYLMEKLIQEAMLAEHKKMESMLKKFENHIGEGGSSIKEKLNEIKWNIQKHFFIEENAVFSLYVPASSWEVSSVDRILREHEEIMKLVEKAEKNLRRENVDKVISMLRSHAKFEDENFYPSLDEQLNSEQKEKILGRVGEIIKG